MSRSLFGPKKSGYTLLSENNHVDKQLTPAQPQNAKASRVYVFGQSDVTEDELHNGEIELSEVRSRKHKQSGSKERESSHDNVIERPISEGDTLQSMALRYGCQVAELKRVNNLIRDQDFFALKCLKVPAKRHGLLTELVEEENKLRGPGGPKLSIGATASADTVIHVVDPSDTDNWDESDPEEKTELLVRTLSIRGAFSSQSKEAQDFLHKMDSDIKNIVSSTKTRKESLDDVTSTLTRKSIQPLQKRRGLFNDVDCGMSWWGPVLVLFVIGLLTPLLYFLVYITHENDNGTTVASNIPFTSSTPAMVLSPTTHS